MELVKKIAPQEKGFKIMDDDDLLNVISRPARFQSTDSKVRPENPSAAIFLMKARPRYRGRVNKPPNPHNINFPEKTMPANFEWGAPTERASSTTTISEKPKMVLGPPKIVSTDMFLFSKLHIVLIFHF